MMTTTMEIHIPLRTPRTTWLCVTIASFFAFLGGRATRIYCIQRPHHQHHTVAGPGPGPAAKNEHSYARNVSALDDEISEKQCIIGRAGVGNCTSSDDTTAKIADLSNHDKGGDENERDDKDDEDYEEEEHFHLQAGTGIGIGQHLFVDIKNVDSAFLNSEQRLTTVMIDVVSASKQELDDGGLTLLSYHCHKRQRQHIAGMGVTCVGILLNSRISFHTWPEEGVITIDLFISGGSAISTGSGGKIITPIIPIIEHLFVIPHQVSINAKGGDVLLQEEEIEDVEEPIVRWWHTYRGFPHDHPTKDLGGHILQLSGLDYKKEIASVQTSFQRIDIYDTIPSTTTDYSAYRNSLQKHNDDEYSGSSYTYKSLHPEFYRPERTVFLDGVLQSTRRSHEAYHEALVHPAMFVHPSPERVAIIGGGAGGGTLREVLKHMTVNDVKMIGMDEEMVMMSREYLPEWNSCADFLYVDENGGGDNDVGWCGDDARAEIYYEDAISWFKDRFANGSDDDDDDGDDGGEADEDDDSAEEEEDDEYSEDPFDVLIMNVLDAQDNTPFADILYNDETFAQALYDSLSNNGIMVLQLGAAPFSKDPAGEYSSNDGAAGRRSTLIGILENVGFSYLRVYEDGNCGLHDPWTFLIAMKDQVSQYDWFQSTQSAEMAIKIHDRMVRMKSSSGSSSSSALQYFDGAVMSSYKYPHKGFESTFCKSSPTPRSCDVMARTFHDRTDTIDVPLSDLDVRMSGVGDGSGRGVYAKVDIKKGSTLGRISYRYPVLFNPSSMELVLHYADISQGLNHVYRYMEGYGWENRMHGPGTYLVEPSILTFVNHGCNATYNIDFRNVKGRAENVTEDNASMEEHKRQYLDVKFDPMLDRHSGGEHELNIALRDIKAGEEILSNYVFYTADDEAWWEEVNELRKICNGEKVGLITQSEMEEQVGKA